MYCTETQLRPRNHSRRSEVLLQDTFGLMLQHVKVGIVMSNTLCNVKLQPAAALPASSEPLLLVATPDTAPS